MKKAIVCGAGGFIGSHLVEFLKQHDYWVRGVDLHYPHFENSHADEFIITDLREKKLCGEALDVEVNEIYQLAADMGGIEYISKGHDADIMHNSVIINANVINFCKNKKCKIFYSSSACVYPTHNQNNSDFPICNEHSVYPANPDNEYGWEKLFSERLYSAFSRDYHKEIRIARFHNIFGTNCIWEGGKEKAPAAICRKIATTLDGIVEIIGDGKQTRSFLFIDEALIGVRKLMDSSVVEPLNIGSTEIISIDNLTNLIADIAGKKINIKHVLGFQGVRGRVSDNHLIKELLGWEPTRSLSSGMEIVYKWIERKINENIYKDMAIC